jgi:hypothetical protein
MSRAKRAALSAGGHSQDSTGAHADRPLNSAEVAEDIGLAALDLAKWARAAGLTTVSYLLENVALEAGTEAAARRWPADQ